MQTPLSFVFPTPRGIPWLAVLITLVLLLALDFIWQEWLFGDWLVRDQWVAPELGPGGLITADPATGDPRATRYEIKYVVLPGLLLLAMAPQRLNWPAAFGPLQRGLLWGFLFWLCVALPIEAIGNRTPMRDPDLFMIDAGRSLLSWLLAGGLIGAWPRQHEADANGQMDSMKDSEETR